MVCGHLIFVKCESHHHSPHDARYDSSSSIKCFAQSFLSVVSIFEALREGLRVFSSSGFVPRVPEKSIPREANYLINRNADDFDKAIMGKRLAYYI